MLFTRFVILGICLVVVPVKTTHGLCATSVQGYAAGLAFILLLCAVVEILVVWVSTRGTVIHTEPRACMPYLIYVRLGMDLLTCL